MNKKYEVDQILESTVTSEWVFKIKEVRKDGYFGTIIRKDGSSRDAYIPNERISSQFMSVEEIKALKENQWHKGLFCFKGEHVYYEYLAQGEKVTAVRCDYGEEGKKAYGSYGEFREDAGRIFEARVKARAEAQGKGGKR